ncbi:hypothetical protein KXD40_001377 [Peronospora effusa]|nr:hypothetical protein KXD40_001377 [Peronospora effusa]
MAPKVLDAWPCPEAIELFFGNEATKFQGQVENEDADDPNFGGSLIADSQPLDPMEGFSSSATEQVEDESSNRLEEEIDS